jgi:hypothetical protein
VLKHLPCNPNVEGSSTTTYDDIRREKMAKCCCEACGSSTVVEFWLCYLKIKGLITAAELARVERKLHKVGVVAQW